MKAVILTNYGSPDYLALIDTDKPEPGDNEVLVKIKASSINSWDGDIIKGIPFSEKNLASLAPQALSSFISLPSTPLLAFCHFLIK